MQRLTIGGSVPPLTRVSSWSAQTLYIGSKVPYYAELFPTLFFLSSPPSINSDCHDHRLTVQRSAVTNSRISLHSVHRIDSMGCGLKAGPSIVTTNLFVSGLWSPLPSHYSLIWYGIESNTQSFVQWRGHMLRLHCKTNNMKEVLSTVWVERVLCSTEWKFLFQYSVLCQFCTHFPLHTRKLQHPMCCATCGISIWKQSKNIWIVSLRFSECCFWRIKCCGVLMLGWSVSTDFVVT